MFTLFMIIITFNDIIIYNISINFIILKKYSFFLSFFIKTAFFVFHYYKLDIN